MLAHEEEGTITRIVHRVVLPILLLSIVLSLSSSPFAHAFSPETVEIIRDTWGIPHVFAVTSEGAFFGLGYASAEDRMFQMEYSRRVVQGRISELLGDQGVVNDRLMRTLAFYRAAQIVAENLDQDTRSLLQAYANGINQYLHDHNGSLPYLFAQYGIQPDPWTVADSIACWYRIVLHFNSVDNGKVASLHTFEDLVAQVGWENATAQMKKPPIIDESGAIVQEGDMDPQLIQEIEEYALQHGYGSESNATNVFVADYPNPKASHAWVVGGSRTSNGSAILHSDPQITITAPSLWYEFHISGGEFDARGIGVAGAPGMLVGWNNDIAWGATAAGADITDLFELQINPSNPNQYYYDGSYRNMQTTEELIDLPNGTRITVACRGTIWGPVITPFLSGVRSGEEFALKHAEIQNNSSCSLKALVNVMKANNWTSFEDSVQDYLAVPLHLIYGDKNGNIGYQLGAGIPLRSTAWPLSGITAQPGNSSIYDWQEIIPKRYLPHMLNPSNGAIGTANNMAVGDWYPLPISLTTGGTGDTIRSWRLRELLANETEFSQGDVLLMHEDRVDPAVREIVRLGRHIVYTLGHQLSQTAQNALAALDTWNGQYDTDQAAYPLIEDIDETFRRTTTPLALTYGGGEAGLCHFAKTIKSRLDTEPGYLPTSDEENYVNKVLSNAWNRTVAYYGIDPDQWLSRYDKTITMKYQDNLEGFGSLNAENNLHSSDLHCKHVSTILSQAGNSYSQNVRFDDIDLSKSILPPGQSENPASTFYDDQVPLWQEGQLHPAPLRRASIETIMTSYITLEYIPYLTGDIDGDFDVDILDVVIITAAYGAIPSSPHWNLQADIAQPFGKVDILDVVKCTSHYGERYS